MTKAWTVEFGEYSGRFVSGVYSSEENAKIAAGDAGDVTEFDLDIGISMHRAGMCPFWVEMGKNGDVRQVKTCGFLTQIQPSFRLALSGSAYPARIALSEWVYHIAGSTWAKDEQHAVKIANEYRVQILASGEWDDAERRWAADHVAA